MDDFERELKRLREEVARSEQLKSRLGGLKSRREQLAAQEEELRERRVDEAEDVEQLEGRSLARYFYSLMGSLDERLERERKEAREAAVRHDSVVYELGDVDDDIEETMRELSELMGCEQRYESAIERHAESLKASGTPRGKRLMELERAMAMLDRRERETDEAIAAGMNAADAASRVADSLSGASAWGVVDVFSDGILADIMKYSHIDNAQAEMEQLRVALRRFDTELADIGATIDTNVAGGFLGFADIFFDNFFTDFAVRSRINNALGSAEDVLRRIEDALARLRALKEECGGERVRLEDEYERVVTNM